LVVLSNAVNDSMVGVLVPLTASRASPGCSLPAEGPGSLTFSAEVGVLGLLDVVAGLLRREHQVAGNQLVLPGAPERQRLAQGQAVALGDRRHVQVPGGLLDGGALDGDHRLAVVVAEGVERRARTQRHVGHRHGGQQHAEDDDGHQRDHHRQNPPVHAPQGSGYG
jgi:hypothetical protein